MPSSPPVRSGPPVGWTKPHATARAICSLPRSPSVPKRGFGERRLLGRCASPATRLRCAAPMHARTENWAFGVVSPRASGPKPALRPPRRSSAASAWRRNEPAPRSPGRSEPTIELEDSPSDARNDETAAVAHSPCCSPSRETRGPAATPTGSGGAPAKSDSASGFGGQGGSFGADGRATGTEIINETAYFVGGVSPVTNHFNNSNGNGKRGYNGPTDDDISQPFVIPNGGDYGGGGGAAQTAGGDNDTPSSGDGGCGHVRILFVARNPFIIREYGGERTVGTGAADETRTINGESVTVRFRDFDPGLSIANNLAAGWPAWNPTPQTGVYYNLLVNYASNVPFLNEGFLPAAVGISTTQF